MLMVFESDAQRKAVIVKLRSAGKANPGWRLPRKPAPRKGFTAIDPPSWFKKARQEQESADILAKANIWEIACYHYHQCAEAAIKGLRPHARARGLDVHGDDEDHKTSRLLQGLPAEYMAALPPDMIRRGRVLDDYFWGGRPYGREVRRRKIEYSSQRGRKVKQDAVSIVEFCESIREGSAD